VTENTVLDPSKFDEFCITVPNDSRLPNAGQQRCGFYDVKPQYFGQGQLRVTNAKEFVGKNGNTGLPYRHWDGFWISADGRLPHNIRMGGGIDVGKNVDDHCFTVDMPNQPYDITGTGGATTWATYNSQGDGACHVVTSWMSNFDFRLNGSVPIKGGFTGSFIFRNTRGAAENATWTVTAANITFKDPAREAVKTTPAGNLTTGTVAVNLHTPNQIYGDRFNQLDLSINKSINVGWGRVRLAFDLYNALNSNSIQNVTTAYTPTGNRWLRPTTFLDPRLARVTAALQF